MVEADQKPWLGQWLLELIEHTPAEHVQQLTDHRQVLKPHQPPHAVELVRGDRRVATAR